MIFLILRIILFTKEYFELGPGCDCMVHVVGTTTTYTIGAYHHQNCEFISCSGEVYSIQHYVIKFVSNLRQVSCFLRYSGFLHQ